MTVFGDSLLSAPMSSTVRAEVRYDRILGKDYENLSERFILNEAKDYATQFYHVYRVRFNCMKPYVERSIRESSLGEDASIKRLSNLSDEDSKVACCVIGTLYKLQKNKPNILRELEGDVQELTPLTSDFTSEDDQLILEDEDQRVRLIGNIHKSKLVTGLILGVYGKQSDGKFDVQQIFFPHSERIKRYIPLKNMYIAFISNIQISHDNSQVLENLQLAMDWLTGFEGCPTDQEQNASIERLVIAGGLLGKGDSKKTGDEAIFENVHLLENALLQLVKSIKVDIIPGQSDGLSNYSMPQQPLHKCLFPRAAPYASTFQTVTNPYFFQIEGTKIYGSSGKNVEDILRNSSLEGPLEVMEEILNWGHICPTSPDTLGCFPYKDKDPFVMEILPHVLFSGSRGKEHLSKVANNTLLFTIPDFSTSGSLVLLDLRDLSTKEIKFSANYSLSFVKVVIKSSVVFSKGVASALTLQFQRSPNLYYRSFDRGRLLFKSNLFLSVANTILKRFRITYFPFRTGIKIATTALKECRGTNVSLTSNWTSNFLSKFDATIHRRAIREIFGRGSPLLAFIGVSLVSNSSSSVNGIVSKKDEIHSVVREIRQTVARSSTLCKSQTEEALGDLKGVTQVQDLDLGSPIAKGASGVVYNAKLKESFSHGYPLALKMMFNYHAESNAFTIFKAMSNEILPAQIRNLKSNSNEVDYFMDYLHWRNESKIETTELPWHPNIVEMFTVFVDQIPNLPQSMSLYPDALPMRINPGGFGRNMSLFLLMKNYENSLKDFLVEQKATGIPLKTSLILLSQLLEGIVHMASNRVAHRDLKSDNILLEYSESKDLPSLVITDFGCSIGTLSIPYQSFDVDKGGNPALMAPEIKKARPGAFVKLDYRKADLWAVSNIAYEIFGAPNPAYLRSGMSQLPEHVPNIIKELIKAIGMDDPNARISPLLAADICQLLLWAPHSWFESDDDIKEDVVLEWLLTITTKVLCEARFAKEVQELKEFKLVSTFLRRICLGSLMDALHWIREVY